MVTPQQTPSPLTALATRIRQAEDQDTLLAIADELDALAQPPRIKTPPPASPVWQFSAEDFLHVAIEINERVTELRGESGEGEDTWFGWSTVDAAELAKMLLSAAALRREVERLTWDRDQMIERPTS